MFTRHSLLLLHPMIVVGYGFNFLNNIKELEFIIMGNRF